MTPNPQRLITDIEKKIINWNERSMFSIKGVKNLSRSDLDTIQLYAAAYVGNSISQLMPPRGGVKEVLEKYGISA